MPRARQESADIRGLVEGFANQLIATVEATVSQRIQTAIAAALNGTAPRGPGRPPKNGLALASVLALAPELPRAKQLCPVPGCKNPAAPVFGMVCSDHKDIPKAKIKEYRDARKKAKDKQQAA